MVRLKIYKVAYVGSTGDGGFVPHERYEVAKDPREAERKVRKKLSLRSERYEAFKAELIKIPGFKITIESLEQKVSA